MLLPEGWSELAPGVDVFFRKGTQNGPVALITAGIHGDEYEGPAAVADVVQELAKVGHLNGSVIAIPVSNPMAWKAGQRTSPDNGLNLARTFPGQANGSATERLAATLFDLAQQADYLIDLHSGGVEYLFLPLCGFYGDAKAENASYQSARHFGLPVLWQLPLTSGVLSSELWKRGRCVVGCEYLGAGQLSPEGRRAYTQGILSCLAHWKVIGDEFLLPETGHACAGDWQLANTEGIFVAYCRVGDPVKPHQLLAEIRSTRGEVLQNFYAETESGFVLAIRSKAYIRPDNWGVLIARPF